MSDRGCVLLIVASLLILISIGLGGKAYDSYKDAHQVTLRVDWPSSTIACYLLHCNADILVDGVKVGTVVPGETKIQFTAVHSKHELSARYMNFGIGLQSNDSSFAATNGAVVYVRYEPTNKDSPLEAHIEKDGNTEEGTPKVRGSEEANAKITRPSEEHLPWNAIGAIAAVVSAIVAIAAFIREN
jgi:hypothetical protein